MYKNLLIKGMSCGHCIMHVEEALNELEGVSDVKVEIGKASAKVSDQTDLATLSDAIAGVGYELISVD